jgi:hypothetical protein
MVQRDLISEFAKFLRTHTLAPPELPARVVVGILLGIVGASLIASQYQHVVHTDFGVSWIGAKAILEGVDPYPLVGRGRPFDYGWPLVYPGTALVALLPFGLLTEKGAATIFVGVSTFLLAFGITRNGWYLLPIFATEAFTNSARLGQWNIILTAALFFPWLASLSVVKPQVGLPVLFGSRSIHSWAWAVLAGLFLLAVSFIVLPNWFREWLPLVRELKHMDPPITRFGGFLILLALLKWKRPEARLLLLLACMPQTPAWYGALPLFTIPKNFTESILLAVVASVGGYLGAWLVPSGLSENEFYSFLGSLYVLTMFLPALILVLLRENSAQGQ